MSGIDDPHTQAMLCRLRATVEQMRAGLTILSAGMDKTMVLFDKLITDDLKPKPAAQLRLPVDDKL
jgi:hypothetical protein